MQYLKSVVYPSVDKILLKECAVNAQQIIRKASILLTAYSLKRMKKKEPKYKQNMVRIKDKVRN